MGQGLRLQRSPKKHWPRSQEEDEASHTHSTSSTDSVSGHVTPSVTMDARVRSLSMARPPSWVSQARQATWAHLLSHLLWTSEILK